MGSECSEANGQKRGQAVGVAGEFALHEHPAPPRDSARVKEIRGAGYRETPGFEAPPRRQPSPVATRAMAPEELEELDRRMGRRGGARAPAAALPPRRKGAGMPEAEEMQAARPQEGLGANRKDWAAITEAFQKRRGGGENADDIVREMAAEYSAAERYVVAKLVMHGVTPWRNKNTEASRRAASITSAAFADAVRALAGAMLPKDHAFVQDIGGGCAVVCVGWKRRESDNAGEAGEADGCQREGGQGGRSAHADEGRR